MSSGAKCFKRNGLIFGFVVIVEFCAQVFRKKIVKVISMLKSVNNELYSINWGNVLGEVQKIGVWSVSALMMAGRFVQIVHFWLLSHGFFGLNIQCLSVLYIRLSTCVN